MFNSSTLDYMEKNIRALSDGQKKHFIKIKRNLIEQEITTGNIHKDFLIRNFSFTNSDLEDILERIEQNVNRNVNKPVLFIQEEEFVKGTEYVFYNKSIQESRSRDPNLPKDNDFFLVSVNRIINVGKIKNKAIFDVNKGKIIIPTEEYFSFKLDEEILNSKLIKKNMEINWFDLPFYNLDISKSYCVSEKTYFKKKRYKEKSSIKLFVGTNEVEQYFSEQDLEIDYYNFSKDLNIEISQEFLKNYTKIMRQKGINIIRQLEKLVFHESILLETREHANEENEPDLDVIDYKLKNVQENIINYLILTKEMNLIENNHIIETCPGIEVYTKVFLSNLYDKYQIK